MILCTVARKILFDSERLQLRLFAAGNVSLAEGHPSRRAPHRCSEGCAAVLHPKTAPMRSWSPCSLYWANWIA